MSVMSSEEQLGKKKKKGWVGGGFGVSPLPDRQAKGITHAHIFHTGGRLGGGGGGGMGGRSPQRQRWAVFNPAAFARSLTGVRS